MTQKSLVLAVLLGALIIAASLVYHAQQLAEVSRRLETMEQRTTGLDNRLEKFSEELPTLVGQAGNNAGRQAVHGMVEEAVQLPLQWLNSRLAPGTNNLLKQVAASLQTNGIVMDKAAPWVLFDIREPVIKIEILPNLKEVPAIPWLRDNSGSQVSPQTHLPGSAGAETIPAAEAK